MPEEEPTAASSDPAVLLAEMAKKVITSLAELDMPVSAEVRAALRVVPRHLFLPGVPLERAYTLDAIVLKRDETGVSISSVSAPTVIAAMLDQLQVKPGHRILEIGSGGYNASLLQELVGDTGQVVSVDIDPDVVARARQSLTAAGYPDVTVRCADGEFGVTDLAPFDRIIVTVGAWDLPPAWSEQLAEGGRLVVPLRMRGLTRSIVFERENGHLADRGYELCGFVPMQGIGERRERLVSLHGEDIRLRLDDDQQADADGLRAALTTPRAEAWSGTTVGKNTRFDGLHLWLSMALPDFGLLAATKEARKRGLVAHSWGLGIPTALDGASFAYLTFRATSTARERFEFGAYGHGPDAERIAQRMVSHVRSWDGTSLNARITAYPAGTPDEQLPAGALVLNKRRARITISWPDRVDTR
ncbi:protein-L-isoaspartate O-methyltransferase [Protofrankia coriariae]|uniref:Protein-L-isoaspartate O-methyltransferase n=1 Tax=Protofrankia coriariae TaxID=1562887 RepID=A0ABR5F1V1_9ACTN|nr:protein-L-isoaspartate O-methyltransferase [Protofrankia coriariae]